VKPSLPVNTDWLNQMADLLQSTKQNIGQQFRNVFAEGRK